MISKGNCLERFPFCVRRSNIHGLIPAYGVIPVDKRDDMIYYRVNSIVNDYGNVT